MKYLLLAVSLALLLTCMAACLPVRLPLLPPPATSLPPAPSETSPPTASPTATIVWFPPTPTYTPLPSVTFSLTPTLMADPHYGELIFSDDFRKPELWTLGRQAAGEVALGKSELSLGVTKPRGYLFSLRQETALGDFYLEVDASPSICRAADEYGLLLRYTSPGSFYRFGLTCRGEGRVDRVVNGAASSAQPPTPHGAIPPGAPSTSRLGVWALGKELRFYVNGAYLFSVRDPVLMVGGLGLYARAASEDSMSVNFSGLEVYEAIP
jgi:hypothetical protein